MRPPPDVQKGRKSTSRGPNRWGESEPSNLRKKGDIVLLRGFYVAQGDKKKNRSPFFDIAASFGGQVAGAVKAKGREKVTAARKEKAYRPANGMSGASNKKATLDASQWRNYRWMEKIRGGDSVLSRLDQKKRCRDGGKRQRSMLKERTST